jgi:RNA polymerase sigma-70 factor, ECF subfamily
MDDSDGSRLGGAPGNWESGGAAADDPGFDPATTVRLLRQVRNGDREALEQLFARYRPALERWARGRLPQWARDIADTQDLVQESMLQTFKRIDVIEPRQTGALYAYLRQAVYNRIRDEVRRLGRRPTVARFTGNEPNNDPSPLEQAIGREAAERYEEALGRLKPDERDAVIGRVEMGYTYPELASVLGKPTAEAARKAAERALVRLGEEMARGRV